MIHRDRTGKRGCRGTNVPGQPLSVQAAKELLSKKGYDPVLGARPLRRTIQREIEDSLSEKILFGELRPGHIVVVDTEGEGDAKTFTFRGEEKSALPDAPPVSIGAGHEENGGEAEGE